MNINSKMTDKEMKERYFLIFESKSLLNKAKALQLNKSEGFWNFKLPVQQNRSIPQFEILK